MLQSFRRLIPLVVLCAAFGCESAARQTAWINAQGGLIQDARLIRAQAACGVLAPAADKAVQVHVLNSDVVSAYGWPDGNLFVTRGLVDAMDDKELSSALAHEMGHLLDDGHLRTVVSLRGCCTNPDAEARADSIGMRLLAERGVDRQAMTSMLSKVKSSPGVSDSCRQKIDRRIELLNQSMAAGG